MKKNILTIVIFIVILTACTHPIIEVLPPDLTTENPEETPGIGDSTVQDWTQDPDIHESNLTEE